MKSPYFLPVVVFLGIVHLSGAAPIVTDVNDLSFSYASGASEVSATGSTLVIETSKNSFATASLPGLYQLQNIGDSMSVTFDFSLDNVMADAASSLNIGFGDSTTGDYQYLVRLNPISTANGITFAETGDTNLGKFDLDSAFGTSTHTVTFTVTRAAAGTAVNALTLSFSSPTLSATTRSAGNDVSPLGTDKFDTMAFGFAGSGFNEEFPAASGDKIDITINNFSVSTTGTAVPEPGTVGLLGMAAALLIYRRRL